MKRIVKIILALNLLVATVLVFVYPHLMLAPGKLIPGHAKLESDCFACHAPFFGSASERCASCHKPEEIGRLTTTGQPLAKPLTKTAFHQKLASSDCVACHSDHAGVKRFRSSGRFDHNLLDRATRGACRSCHEAPRDKLHRQISGQCSSCHGQQKWRPATFDHREYFVLDRKHNVQCATCHQGSDYRRYTCYGCHEHTQENIRREHIEEGIRDYSNCTECHRSADEHDIRGRGKHGESRREGRHGDDDDD